MHDVLRARVLRKIESLPEEQIYQVLDYIEFLESRYTGPSDEPRASGFQRIGEEIEDRMRRSSFKPSNLREAFQVIAAADRALSGVAKAGRQLFDDIAGGGGTVEGDRDDREGRTPDRADDRRPRQAEHRSDWGRPGEAERWDREGPRHERPPERGERR